VKCSANRRAVHHIKSATAVKPGYGLLSEFFETRQENQVPFYLRSDSDDPVPLPMRPGFNPGIACPRELPNSERSLGPTSRNTIPTTRSTLGKVKSSRKNRAVKPPDGLLCWQARVNEMTRQCPFL